MLLGLKAGGRVILTVELLSFGSSGVCVMVYCLCRCVGWRNSVRILYLESTELVGGWVGGIFEWKTDGCYAALGAVCYVRPGN